MSTKPWVKSLFNPSGLNVASFQTKSTDGLSFNDITLPQDAIGGESDKVKLIDCQDTLNRYRTPFDGQEAYFHLDMNDYADTPSTVQI